MVAAHALKKFLWHSSIGLIVWVIISYFSPAGRLYAGFMVAFMGFCYLLVSWLEYLKSKGTDVIARLKPKTPPQIPFFHRKNKVLKPRLWFWGNKHFFDDDLPRIIQESNIPLIKRQKLKAMIYALVGIFLLALSTV